VNKTAVFKEIKNKAEEVLNSGNRAYIEATLPKVYDLFVAAVEVFGETETPLHSKKTGTTHNHLGKEAYADHDYFLQLIDITIAYHEREEPATVHLPGYVGHDRRDAVSGKTAHRQVDRNIP